MVFRISKSSYLLISPLLLYATLHPIALIGGVARPLQAKGKLAKKLADATVDIRKAEHKLGRMEKEASDAGARVMKLAADYPWIPSEQVSESSSGITHYPLRNSSSPESISAFCILLTWVRPVLHPLDLGTSSVASS